MVLMGIVYGIIYIYIFIYIYIIYNYIYVYIYFVFIIYIYIIHLKFILYIYIYLFIYFYIQIHVVFLGQLSVISWTCAEPAAPKSQLRPNKHQDVANYVYNKADKW